ncbi:IS3 family transposase [Streptomyces sp. NPDC008222]|uniref:IS3 family transposase n=1 Tax=Streptomyces sp. NPDC008222 TaxID=3364820 RepID=UPI0036E9C950
MAITDWPRTAAEPDPETASPAAVSGTPQPVSRARPTASPHNPATPPAAPRRHQHDLGGAQRCPPAMGGTARAYPGEVAAADPVQVARMINDCKAGQNIPHNLSCRVLGVSESWFYKWRDRPVTAREVRRGEPADAIEHIFDASGGTYGSPKIWITLIREGWRVSVNTAAELMAELGLAGRKIRRRRGLTRPGRRAAAPDFVRRDFTADAPDQVWAGDMTEIVTSEGKLYLATVIDLFSRRLPGYAMGAHHDVERTAPRPSTPEATRRSFTGQPLDREFTR